MARDPIIFAMANPDPEITPEDAFDARKDVIMATGRSDYPNQVNNVLGFPFIFRGALDVMATAINDEMKLAAAHALAKLAKEDVPDSVIKAYGGEKIKFGRDYIIPKPLDPRVLLWEAPAVAKAAMETGVARKPIDDLDAYRDSAGKPLRPLEGNHARVYPQGAGSPEAHCVPRRQGRENPPRQPDHPGRRDRDADPARRPEGHRGKDQSARPGSEGRGDRRPDSSPKFDDYVKQVLRSPQAERASRGRDARSNAAKPRFNFGMMMVQRRRRGRACGRTDATLSRTPSGPRCRSSRPRPGISTIAGMYMLIFKNDVRFIADATVNFDPTAEQLADIAILAAEKVRSFDIEPRIAMLSFSNFGSTPHPSAQKMARAAELVKTPRARL